MEARGGASRRVPDRVLGGAAGRGRAGVSAGQVAPADSRALPTRVDRRGHAAAPGRACTRCPVFGTRVKRGMFRALVRRGSGSHFVRPKDSGARILGPKLAQMHFFW